MILDILLHTTTQILLCLTSAAALSVLPLKYNLPIMTHCSLSVKPTPSPTYGGKTFSPRIIQQHVLVGSYHHRAVYLSLRSKKPRLQHTILVAHHEITSISSDFDHVHEKTGLGLGLEVGPPVDLQYMCLKNSSNNNHEDTSKQYPPVILLHGLLGQKRNLASLGASLHSQLKKKRDVYAVDLRNHGDNAHDWRDDMSYSHMALDIIHFMNQQNIQNAVLIGHSMGGKLAASLALSHPERVQGLIILDISPVTYTLKDTAWKAVQDIVDTLDQVDITNFEKKVDLDMHLRESVEDPSLRAFILTSIESVQGKRTTSKLRWKINLDAIVQQMNVLAGFDVWFRSSSETSLQHLQYEGDVFFLNSSISRYIKHSHMDTISGYFPNFMLTTLKGVGHSLHTDSPEATVALLKKYLDR